jgi:hypothetical protein
VCVCAQGIRVIKICISWWLEQNHKLSEIRCGFRQNKGYTDNLAILTSEIIKVSEVNPVWILFCDIRSAYCNVHCNTLLNSFKEIDFSENLLTFIFILVPSRNLEANYRWLDLFHQYCKLLKYTDNTVAYLVNRHSKICIWEVGNIV